MSKRLIDILILTLSVTGTTSALAATDPHAGHGGHTMVAAAATAEPTTATVKKVDLPAGKVTLAHGPLKNLGMPAMTMVFKVNDRAVLGKLKAGDKIRFVAEMAGRDYLATRIEPAQ